MSFGISTIQSSSISQKSSTSLAVSTVVVGAGEGADEVVDS